MGWYESLVLASLLALGQLKFTFWMEGPRLRIWDKYQDCNSAAKNNWYTVWTGLLRSEAKHANYKRWMSICPCSILLKSDSIEPSWSALLLSRYLGSMDPIASGQLLVFKYADLSVINAPRARFDLDKSSRCRGKVLCIYGIFSMNRSQIAGLAVEETLLLQPDWHCVTSDRRSRYT